MNPNNRYKMWVEQTHCKYCSRKLPKDFQAKKKERWRKNIKAAFAKRRLLQKAEGVYTKHL